MSSALAWISAGRLSSMSVPIAATQSVTSPFSTPPFRKIPAQAYANWANDPASQSQPANDRKVSTTFTLTTSSLDPLAHFSQPATLGVTTPSDRRFLFHKMFRTALRTSAGAAFRQQAVARRYASSSSHKAPAGDATWAMGSAAVFGSITAYLLMSGGKPAEAAVHSTSNMKIADATEKNVTPEDAPTLVSFDLRTGCRCS
jgi:hypothetical protein